MSEHPQEQTEAKLLAYIEGELDDAGRADIDRHLEANPKHRRLLADLAAGRDMLRRLPHPSAPPELYEGFQAQLERQVLLEPVAAADVNPATGNYRISTRWTRLRTAAAAAVVAGGIGLIVYSVMPRTPGETPRAVNKNPTPPSAVLPTAPASNGGADAFGGMRKDGQLAEGMADADGATTNGSRQRAESQVEAESADKRAPKNAPDPLARGGQPDDRPAEAGKRDAGRRGFEPGGGPAPAARGLAESQGGGPDGTTPADVQRRFRMARAAEQARALPGVQVAVGPTAYKQKTAERAAPGTAGAGGRNRNDPATDGTSGPAAALAELSAAAGERAESDPLVVVVASADPSAAETRVAAALHRVGLYARADNVYGGGDRSAGGAKKGANAAAASPTPPPVTPPPAPMPAKPAATPPAAAPAATPAPAVAGESPAADPRPTGSATDAVRAPGSRPAAPAPSFAAAATRPTDGGAVEKGMAERAVADAAQPTAADGADADLSSVLVVRRVSRDQAAALVAAMNQPDAAVYAAAYDAAPPNASRAKDEALADRAVRRSRGAAADEENQTARPPLADAAPAATRPPASPASETRGWAGGGGAGGGGVGGAAPTDPATPADPATPPPPAAVAPPRPASPTPTTAPVPAEGSPAAQPPSPAVVAPAAPPAPAPSRPPTAEQPTTRPVAPRAPGVAAAQLRRADADRPIEAGETLRVVYGGLMGVSSMATVGRDGGIVVAGHDGRLAVVGLTPREATDRANAKRLERSATAAPVEIRRPTAEELAQVAGGGAPPAGPLTANPPTASPPPTTAPDSAPVAVPAGKPAAAEPFAARSAEGSDELVDLVIVLQREAAPVPATSPATQQVR